MLKSKIVKVIVAILCIMTLVMPNVSFVFGIISPEDTTAKIEIISMHEGGYPCGELTTEEREVYDLSPWEYKVNDDIIYKLIEFEDYEYNNYIFCVDATVTFPGFTDPYQDYVNKGDYLDATNPNLKTLHMGTSGSSDTQEWKDNYRATAWLFKNIYLPKKDAPSKKNIFLQEVFRDFTDERLAGKSDEEKLSIIRTYLTDDDIDVTEQEAIWHFTNKDLEKYAAMNTISRRNNVVEELPQEDSDFRNKMMKHLYSYLVNGATNNVQPASIEVPSFRDTTITSTSNDNFYVVGPFNINPGTYKSSEYTVSVLNQNEEEISDYRICIDGESEFTSKSLNEITNTNFYVYIPSSARNVDSVTVKLKYNTNETSAVLWENARDSGSTLEYQPVVVVTRIPTEHNAKQTVPLDKKKFDLAVREYIVKVGNQTVNRKPNVDVTDLKNGDATSAKYKHAKSEIVAKAGETIVYEVRVYNEGDIPAKGVKVAVTMPKGLEFDEENEINRSYNWVKAVNGDGTNRIVYITDYLQNEIRAFDKENDTEPPSDFVQIAFKVSDDAISSKVLTTVTEITEANSKDGQRYTDRDSTPQNNDYVIRDLDATNYSGDNSNKADLTDKNYHYRGRQDDDDFEKIQADNPEKPAFDLSMKKFVSGKKGSSTLASSREPKVNVTPLKNGKTDAEYSMQKSGVQAKVGDIITYTLRVYNEGLIDGYAEEVSDYIPEGLGYILNYKANEDNYWQLPKDGTAIKTIKLNTIENAKDNVTKDEFTSEISSVDDVEVVVGGLKLTSTKLKSDATTETNLIKAFDRENGTTLNYKDVSITCVVLSTDNSSNKLRNIGEIVKVSDKDKNEIEDIDSVCNSVVPENYPDTEKRSDGTFQDDNDYESLTPEAEKIQNFDLSAKKFITAVNDGKVTDRVPVVTKGTNGKPVITMTNNTPYKVANNDLVTYTIRIYNEGDTAGYAKEVADNIPAGLVYVGENDTNKKYGWKLYDKNGNETSDINQAILVKTDYLSKTKSEDRNEKCLLAPYNAENSTISYQDVLIVFRVDENAVDATRTITNLAEITDDEDENGMSVEDVDSTPGNWKDSEDDIAKEQLAVKVFDLALQKYLSKIIIVEDGQTREIDVKSTDGLQKVEVHRKKINSTIVKFVYTIVVKNEGEIAGFADEIADYIPEGLEFIPEDNSGWTKVTDRVATTNALIKTLIEPGQSASTQITLKWINGDKNFGLRDNVAEINKSSNPNGAKDRDSTAGNRVVGEDDQDNASVMIAISTGNAPMYIAIIAGFIFIVSGGYMLIKKYVL